MHGCTAHKLPDQQLHSPDERSKQPRTMAPVRGANFLTGNNMDDRIERSVWHIAIVGIVIFVGITMLLGMIGGQEAAIIASQ